MNEENNKKSGLFWGNLPDNIKAAATLLAVVVSLVTVIANNERLLNTLLPSDPQIEPSDPPNRVIIEKEISEISLRESKFVHRGQVELYVSRVNPRSIRLRSNLWEDEWLRETQKCNNLPEGDKKTCERNADKGLFLNKPVIVNKLEEEIEIELIDISMNPRSATLKITIKSSS